MTAESSDASATVYADYRTFMREDSTWQTGSIKLGNGSYWEYREPAAKISVKHGNLRIQVDPLTRSHDKIQTLDNAKHLYFSKKSFPTKLGSDSEYGVRMSAIGINNVKGDFYDGFITFHLLDAESGIAADFFASDTSVAMAYSRPREVRPAESPMEKRYLVVFKEIDVTTSPGVPHEYRIVYSHHKDELTWVLDGERVALESNVPSKIPSFRLGLGIMTAKNIADGRSVSIHGQGMIGEWSPIRISM